MLIVADANIPCLDEAFGPLGEVRTYAGREITPQAVDNADVLLVRSVTHVGRELLGGSKVRFVGTATAGVDHVDAPWLDDQGIEFASAPGCNAESVAQYIAAVLCHLRSILGGKLRGRSIGIVGVGQCGSRVERVARALDMEPVLCDPLLGRESGEPRFRPLAGLTDCDFITLHVPLTQEGEDATAGMIDAEFIRKMKPGSVLINAARGGVVDESEWVEALRMNHLSGAAVDAWSGEPHISWELLPETTIATPHIAGYSLDGKLKGVEIIHTALCRYLDREPFWDKSSALPRIIRSEEVKADAEEEDAISKLVGAGCPLVRDDSALRRAMELPLEQRGTYFDSLRKSYPVRREFAATEVTIDPERHSLRSKIEALGFSVKVK